MQKTVTVELNFVSSTQLENYCGMEVAWSLSGDSIHLQSGGLFDCSFYQTIEMVGSDTIDFLHRMSTVNFNILGQGQGAYGAFLTRSGGVVSLGFFERGVDRVCIHLPFNLVETTLAHIEKFHFAEKFQVSKLKDTLVAGWFPPHEKDSAEKINALDISMPDHLLPSKTRSDEWIPTPLIQVSWNGVQGTGFWDPARPGLFWARIDRMQIKEVGQEFLKQGLPWLGTSLFEYLRIENGVPLVPDELGEKDIILEGDCQWAIARNKGCYPGQEVVERIFTYGSVNRLLKRVYVEGRLPVLPMTVGPIKLVACFDPKIFGGSDSSRGLAFVPKSEWKSTKWSEAGVTVKTHA